MPDRKLPDPGAELSEAEARQKLEEANALLARRVDQAKKQFSYSLKLAQDRLQFATKELAAAKSTLVQLEPFRAEPEGAMHYRDVESLCKVYACVRRLMQLEVECHQHNLEQLEREWSDVPDELPFRVPQQEVGYLEVRSFLDLTLASFYCTQSVEGLDAVLRATVGLKAIQCRDAADEARCVARANALRQAMKGNKALMQLVGQLANEFQETMALLEWGQTNLRRAYELPPQEKLKALGDEDWAKLNGKVVWLGELPRKVKPFAELAPYFPEIEPPPVPFELVAWVEPTTSPLGAPPRPSSGRLSPPAARPTKR